MTLSQGSIVNAKESVKAPIRSSTPIDTDNENFNIKRDTKWLPSFFIPGNRCTLRDGLSTTLEMAIPVSPLPIDISIIEFFINIVILA
jgi:hypothetical protein